MEAGTTGALTENLLPSVETVVATGEYDGHAGFVPTHRHTADELRAEIRQAGLVDAEIYGVEGPAWPALDVAGAHEFAARAEAALRCARLVERDPLLINASAHFPAVARSPERPVVDRAGRWRRFLLGLRRGST